MKYSTVGGATEEIDKALSAADALLALLTVDTLDSDAAHLDTINEKVKKLKEDVEQNKEDLIEKAEKMKTIDDEVTGGWS